MLACCYTHYQHPLTSSIPAALYIDRTRPPQISALRLHSRYRFSPAHGYHPRYPTPVPAWPGLFSGPSREDKLVDAVTSRRLKQRSQNFSSMDQSTDEESSETHDDVDAHSNGDSSHDFLGDQHAIYPVPSKPQTARSVKANPLRRSNLRRISTTPVLFPSRIGKQKRFEGSQSCLPNQVGWTLRPLIRSESHPLPVQPVKAYSLQKASRRREASVRKAQLKNEDAGGHGSGSRHAKESRNASRIMSRISQVELVWTGWADVPSVAAERAMKF